MTIYGIKCICSNWDGCNGCDTDEYLLDYFFSTREKAEETILQTIRENGAEIVAGS